MIADMLAYLLDTLFMFLSKCTMRCSLF